ncbi:MAG: NACHT domain-containing protein [Saccharothrix sp.]|nr:NACHT domain-containing protein [Saccharothrix sp.]
MTGTFVGLLLTVLAGAGTALYRLVLRYRRSVARESQSFLRYIAGSVRLSVGRRVKKSLAAQFGVRRYAELKLATFPSRLYVPSVDDAAIDIDTAYVRLSLSGARHRVTDDALLADDIGAVLLFGDPGSGKSSLTKKLFRQACRQAYRRPDVHRLPVHVELRNLDWTAARTSGRDAGTWLREELFDLASRVEGTHDPLFTLDAWAGRNGLLVLLDGMDEVPERCLDFAIDAIRGLTTALRGRSTRTSVIVTARTQLRGALSRGFLGGMNAVYTVEPFTAADIFEFLRKWPYPQGRSGEAQRILNTLLEHRTLAEMCGNPLILSMYVAQDQRYARSPNLGSARLPDTRTDFYRTVIGELLVHRHSQQFGSGQGTTETRRAREELLGRIALDHLHAGDEPANSLSWRDAVATTRRLTGLPTETRAEAHLRALAVDTGVFTEERVGESFRFMHLTLCEYLAAVEASESGSPSFADLLDAVAQPDGSWSARLSEVVVFTTTLFKRSERLLALAELRSRGAPPDLVLRAARECQAYQSEVFRLCVADLRDHLAGVDVTRWDEDWFAALRLLITAVDEARRSERAADLDDTEVLLRALTGLDPRRLDRVFEMWLEFHPAESLATARLLERLDPDFDLTGRFVAAMDRVELLTHAISRVSTLADDHAHWTLLLAEAALITPLVAQRLSKEPPPAAAPRREETTWATTGAAKETLLGWVLSRAVEQFPTLLERTRRAVPRVGLLRAVPPGDVPELPTAATGVTAVRFARISLLVGVGGLLSLVLSALTSLSGTALAFGVVFPTSAAFTALIALAAMNATGVSLTLLNLSPRTPGNVPRYVLVSANGTTELYVSGSWTGPAQVSLDVLRERLRAEPLPTVCGNAGLDLRGMAPARQAVYLLTEVIKFERTAPLAGEWPTPRRAGAFRLLYLLALPQRYRRNVLMPSDLTSANPTAAASE